jgi:hypothetical protein
VALLCGSSKHNDQLAYLSVCWVGIRPRKVLVVEPSDEHVACLKALGVTVELPLVTNLNILGSSDRHVESQN